QLCSCVLNSPKYLQVRIAARRRNKRSFSEASVRESCGGRFSHIETSLLLPHKTRIGKAEINEPSKTESDYRHPVEIGINRSALVSTNLGFSRSFPFEQALPSEESPHNRPHHRVHGNQHLVGEENEAQQDIEVRREKR